MIHLQTKQPQNGGKIDYKFYIVNFVLFHMIVLETSKHNQKSVVINYQKLYQQKCVEFDKLMNELKLIKKELDQLKHRKGRQCSINGIKYEKKIYNIVRKCKLNEKIFNTQKDNEIGGCTNDIDIQCNNHNEKDIGIEVKKCNSPDWIQCSLKYNNITKKWKPSPNGKIPKECQEIFELLISNITLYDGNLPPFMKHNITHNEWLNIKKSTDKWNDVYIDIPNDIIAKLYSFKKCSYIQISKYGLYHLGNDICNFNVPKFIIDQQIRIRTKIHSKANKNGYCQLSVIAACQPKNIKKLKLSKFSLDDKEKLPHNLHYDPNI